VTVSSIGRMPAFYKIYNIKSIGIIFFALVDL
jgi:hypothetical protein